MQPVQLTFRPTALRQLSDFAAEGPRDTHSKRVLAAINALDSPVARTLAKARKVWSTGAACSFTLQVPVFDCFDARLQLKPG